MKFTLQRVRLNQGGYDRTGTYWGVGQPLYWYCMDAPGWEWEAHMRADNREHAKAKIRELYPEAKFYN